MNKIIKISMIMTLLIGLMSATLYATNDKSIKGNLRTDIQNSMSDFIQSNVINNQYPMFDEVTGKMLYLQLKIPYILFPPFAWLEKETLTGIFHMSISDTTICASVQP